MCATFLCEKNALFEKITEQNEENSQFRRIFRRMRRRKASVVPVADGDFESDDEWRRILDGVGPGGTATAVQAFSKSAPWRRQPDTPVWKESADDKSLETNGPTSAKRSEEVSLKKTKVIHVKRSAEDVNIINNLSMEVRTVYDEIKSDILQHRGKRDALIKEYIDAEIRKSELEARIDELEEENMQLQVVLAKGLEASNQAQHRKVTGKVDKERVDPGASFHEDYRKVLFSEESSLVEEETAQDLNEMGRLEKIVYKAIKLLTPFEAQTKAIQASYGGAVASYFLFLRWM